MYGQNQQQEINVLLWSAIEEGDHARTALEEALNLLNSARKWGRADMLGGKLVVTGVKRSQLHQAVSLVRQAETSLQQLEEALPGIHISEMLKIKLNPIVGALDYALDNLVTDAIAQGEINTARQQVQHALEELNQVLSYVADELGGNL